MKRVQGVSSSSDGSDSCSLSRQSERKMIERIKKNTQNCRKVKINTMRATSSKWVSFVYTWNFLLMCLHDACANDEFCHTDSQTHKMLKKSKTQIAGRCPHGIYFNFSTILCIFFNTFNHFSNYIVWSPSCRCGNVLSWCRV